MFTINDCGVGGSLPKHINLNKIKHFGLFDNHLSCDMSKTFINNSLSSSYSILNDSVILIGNNFEYDTNEQVQWMKGENFTLTSNLYLTPTDILLLYLTIMLPSSLSAILMTIFHTFRHFCEKYQKHKQFSQLSGDTLGTLVGQASNIIFEWYHFVWAIVASMFWYFIASSYFECGRITSKTGIVYYESYNSIWIDIVTLILLTIFNCLILFGIVKIVNIMTTMKMIVPMQTQEQELLFMFSIVLILR